MKKIIRTVLVVLLLVEVGCQDPLKTTSNNGLQNTVRYANGFQLIQKEGYTELIIKAPWPDATKNQKVALIPNTFQADTLSGYDDIIVTPISSIVVTSTTHIPSLEMLEVLPTLVGFPEIAYISSPTARHYILNNKVAELGQNEQLNTEKVLTLQPNALITFAINGQIPNASLYKRAKIPVIYNGDWLETHPLGKAEWLKLFGALYNRQSTADSIFNTIEANYNQTKLLAAKAIHTPTVLSGAMYKDIWYLPQGDSWAAQFIKDANANYLWANTEGTGSAALSMETVLEKAQNADYWIGTSQFTTYQQLANANNAYTLFNAYKQKKAYTFASRKGEGGGLLYYELAPNRPDWVLKDLVKILHPELMPEYELQFFNALR